MQTLKSLKRKKRSFSIIFEFQIEYYKNTERINFVPGVMYIGSIFEGRIYYPTYTFWDTKKEFYTIIVSGLRTWYPKIWHAGNWKNCTSKLTVTFPCLAVWELAIKEFSDLRHLKIGHKTLILKGSWSIPGDQEESEQTGLVMFQSHLSLPSLLSLDHILFVQSYFSITIHFFNHT